MNQVGDDDMKYCYQCEMEWPRDAAFFPPTNGRLYSPCRACREERRIEKSEQETCCIRSCGLPRLLGKSRCNSHQRQYEMTYHRLKRRLKKLELPVDSQTL